MKTCTRCLETKEGNGFYRDKSKSDGFRSLCKMCVEEHRRTPDGIKVRDRWNHSEEARIVRDRYDKSSKARETRIRLRSGKVRDRSQQKAHYAIRMAIAKGIVSRADSQLCYNCQKPAKHYHHYLGYEDKYHLSVIPLCAKCHKSIHS